MLIEQTLMGSYNKVDKAIELLKTYEPIALENNPNGFYVASSFGKDSQAIIILCILANVKFEVHCNHTTLDTPELARFEKQMKEYLKENFDIETHIHYPKESAWQLIPRKLMPPTRISRYCCDALKESGGIGRICITGVRWEESSKRANNRSLLEANDYTKKKIRLNNDNDESRRLMETCITKGKHMINLIISWLEEDVWELTKNFKQLLKQYRNIDISYNSFPYCELYDQGWNRFGCIGCPLSSNQENELELYPIYKENYLKAFRRMTIERKKKGKTFWIEESDAEEIMEWWIHGTIKEKQIRNQIKMELNTIEDF